MGNEGEGSVLCVTAAEMQKPPLLLQEVLAIRTSLSGKQGVFCVTLSKS